MGRDYLKVGQIMEILRQRGVRLIAINDGVDSARAVSYTHLALQSQQRREIKIKRYARVIEGHILDFKPGKRRRS